MSQVGLKRIFSQTEEVLTGQVDPSFERPLAKKYQPSISYHDGNEDQVMIDTMEQTPIQITAPIYEALAAT